MLVTSEKNIFPYKLDAELTDQLNRQLHDLNWRMAPIKREWAKSVMAYNLTSKEAFIHRFVALPQKDGRNSPDGNEQDFATGEQLTGKYVCSTLVKEKVDNYLLEYQSREYSCNVQSVAREEDKYLVQFLQNQSFNTPQFRLANQSAFKDALLKKVGWLRPRIYDLSKEQKQMSFGMKNGEKTIKIKNKKVDYKKGLEIEYVDAENVYIDPYSINPQECFISTPYTDMELLAMFPFLKKELSLNIISNSNLVLDEIRDTTKETDNSLQPQWIDNYKVGENFSSWYFDPEMMLNFTKYSSAANNVSPKIDSSKSDGGWDFKTKDMNKFHQIWNSAFLGTDYNKSGTAYFNYYRKFRLNEFYNWSQDRYVVWIDKYVLYDGPMFEPYKECPLVPIYFDKDSSNGIYGKSVFDHLHTIQYEASDNETLLKQSSKMASVTFLEMNTDRLEDPNTPIQANLLTIVKTKNTQDGESANIPAIQQIGIANQGVEMTGNILNKWNNTAEKLFPSSNQVNLQLSKEEREQVIGSRVMRPNSFLKGNAEQLSLFAYNVFTAKLFELKYFNVETIAIPIDATKTRALVIKNTEEEIVKAKKYINDRLSEEYQARIEQASAYLMEDQNFQTQIQEFRNNKAQEYQQKMSNPEFLKRLGQSPDQAKLAQFINQQLEMETQKFVQGKAQELVQPIKDENMYICLDDLDNLIQSQKQFVFSFKESKEEVQRNLTSFLATISQLPLAGYALDYAKFIREIAINNGFNPEVILQEVGRPAELAAMASTRMQIYADMQKNPAMAEAFLGKMYGIDKNQLAFDPQSPVYANLKAIQDLTTQSQIAVQSTKQAQDGQNKLAQEGFKATTQSLTQSPENAGLQEETPMQNLMQAPKTLNENQQ
jgi:hypothetical protein